MQDAASADLILVNGKVLTMDAADSTAEALAIKDGRILAVGSNRETEALSGSRTEAVDLKGRTALPGLADIHVHLASDAGKTRAVEARDFYDPDIRSVRDIQERIRRRAVQTPPDEWIVASGSLRERAQFLVKSRGADVDVDSLAEHILRDLGVCVSRTTVDGLKLAPERFRELPVDLTITGGRVVYGG